MKLGRKKEDGDEQAAPTGAKTIEVVKMGADNKPESIKNVDIPKGTKTIDVKEQLGYRASDTLIRAKTEQVLANKTDIFKALEDGEKVIILPDTRIGC